MTFRVLTNRTFIKDAPDNIYLATKSCFAIYCGAPDTRNVMFLHGLPGAFSGIVSVFMALLGANKMVYGKHLYKVFPAMATGRTSKGQASFQLVGTTLSVGMGLVAGSICGSITKSKCFKPLKTEEQFDDVQYWELPK